MSRLNVILVIMVIIGAVIISSFGTDRNAETSGRIFERYFSIPQDWIRRPTTDRSDGRRIANT